MPQPPASALTPADRPTPPASGQVGLHLLCGLVRGGREARDPDAAVVGMGHGPLHGPLQIGAGVEAELPRSLDQGEHGAQAASTYVVPRAEVDTARRDNPPADRSSEMRS